MLHDGLFALAGIAGLLTSAGTPSDLQVHATRYYDIFSDLDAETIKEAELRITRMAEEYHHRTKGFAGQITERLPFYLFANPDDYYAAGGLPRSGGVYTGDRLMAIAGKPVSESTWSLVQHEGFHQFVDAVIGGDIPVWVNEGLAEYFGEAVFTGEGFETGLIPPARLARVRQAIRQKTFKSLPEMMQLGRRGWNHQMDLANYDQAWSMIHFLAHGEGGKYQKHLDGFLRDVSRKRLAWDLAWKNNFGAGTEGFENRWREYWLSLPDEPSAAAYARATVTTLTTFLARSAAAGQSFTDFDAFADAARSGGLRQPPELWLPPSLARRAVEESATFSSCRLERRGNRYNLGCQPTSGREVIGRFELDRGRIRNWSVE